MRAAPPDQSTAAGWVPPSPGRRPDAALRLLALYHAAGTSQALRPLAECAPRRYDVCAIELPGHGRRLREPAVDDFSELVGMVLEGVGDLLDRPLVVYGQSMGAALGFELSARLAEAGQPVEALIVAGRDWPGAAPAPPLHELSDAALLRWWRRMGTTPPEVIDDPELRAMVLPVLRADLRAVERYRPHARRVDCPIHVLAGVDDPSVTDRGLAGWSRATTARATVHRVASGHLPLTEPAALSVIAGVLDGVSERVLAGGGTRAGRTPWPRQTSFRNADGTGDR